MPQPFDYRLQVQNPMEAALSGLRLGAGIQEMRDARAAALAKQDTERRFREGFQSVIDNPNATGEDYSRLMAIDPSKVEIIKQNFEMRDESSRKADLQATQKAYFAAMNGDPQTAANALLENATAYRNSGREEDAKRMEAAADAIAANPAQAKATMGIFLSSVAPKDWAETISKVGVETRAQEVAPYESEVKRVDAKYSEKTAEATLAKMAADAKKVKDEETGLVPADKRPEYEAKMRKEYADQTAAYSDVRTAFEKIKTAENTAAGDLSLIFSYMKMLDPSSAVREGEFANAQNAAGIPSRIVNAYNNALKGTRLNGPQRTEFVSQAGRLHDAEKKKADMVRSGLTRIAKNNGLNSDNIFYEVETQVDY